MNVFVLLICVFLPAVSMSSL
ncbi:hypothetical protein [Sphingobacterium sp.]